MRSGRWRSCFPKQGQLAFPLSKSPRNQKTLHRSESFSPMGASLWSGSPSRRNLAARLGCGIASWLGQFLECFGQVLNQGLVGVGPARQRRGSPKEVAGSLGRTASQHDALPQTLEEQILVDVDLSILGGDEQRFANDWRNPHGATWRWLSDDEPGANERQALRAGNSITSPGIKMRIRLHRQIASRIADNPRSCQHVVHRLMRVAVYPQRHRRADQFRQIRSKRRIQCAAPVLLVNAHGMRQVMRHRLPCARNAAGPAHAAASQHAARAIEAYRQVTGASRSASEWPGSPPSPIARWPWHAQPSRAAFHPVRNPSTAWRRETARRE